MNALYLHVDLELAQESDAKFKSISQRHGRYIEHSHARSNRPAYYYVK